MQLTALVLEGFVRSILSKKFDNAAIVPDCHREWWEMCCGDNQMVAIAAPRGHAKSTAITHSYTLGAVLFRERKFVLLVSDTEGQAAHFLGDIASEIRENTDIQQMFGIRRLSKDTATDIIVEFDDGEKFRIIAKGSEQKVRGLKWEGRRPDLIVGDDLENDEIVLNQERREKFRRWFYGALLPCRSANGIVRIVGTILHLDAILERLMPKDHNKFTVEEDLKSYSTLAKTQWKSIRYRAHNEDFSKILWPARWTKEKLIAERQDYIDQGIPDVYSQEFLNYPLDQSRAYFKKADFTSIFNHELQDIDSGAKILNYYIGGDLAISEKERADYCAFIIAGMDEHGILYVVDVIRERLDSMEIVDTILALQRRYEPQFFVIEQEKITKAIGPYLREAMLKSNVMPSIVTMLPSADKQTRARSIQARMRIGGIKFDKSADWYGTFEDELLKFPKARHDDQVDAFAYIGLALDKYTEAPTQEEQNDEDWEDEYYKNDDSYDAGRCATTGY